MKSSIFTTAIAIFASAASASPLAARKTKEDAAAAPKAVVNIIAVNKPISGEASSRTVSVPFGKLTHFDKTSVTGFQIEGVTVANIPGSPQVDESTVVCRRYRDQYGVQPGSALFTVEEEALISTNSVDFGWVLCWIG